MELIENLIKQRPWLKQFVRFCIVGVLSTVVYAGSAVILLDVFGLRLTFANFGAFLVAATFSYLSHALYSFEAGAGAMSLAKFSVLASLVFASTVVISEWVIAVGLSPYYGIAIVSVVAPLISFLVQKFWVFRQP